MSYLFQGNFEQSILDLFFKNEEFTENSILNGC